MKKIAILTLLCLSLAACNKEEGKGGTSTLQGYVYNVIHADDNYLLTVDTFPAAKTDVYIVYGDNPHYGSKTEASPNGFYQFKYLTKGNYKVFAYSTLASGEKVGAEKSVKLGSGTTTADTIFIHTGKANSTALIRGQVEIKYWNKDDKAYVDAYSYPPAILERIPKYAADIRVYIRRAGESFYFDDVRTDENGVFIFQKLQPGQYEVFTYSADKYILETTNKKTPCTVKAVIEITETNNQIYDLPENLKIIDTF